MPMSREHPGSRPVEARERVRHYRARMRAAGLRPIQIWVPDTRSEAFRAQAHRQSLAVARSADGELDQAFIDAVSARCRETGRDKPSPTGPIRPR